MGLVLCCYKEVLLNAVLQYTQVDTEVCEQVFSWLSRYSHTTHMSQHTFAFFVLYLCDIHNMHEKEKLHRAGFLGFHTH